MVFSTRKYEYQYTYDFSQDQITKRIWESTTLKPTNNFCPKKKNWFLEFKTQKKKIVEFEFEKKDFSFFNFVGSSLPQCVAVESLQSW